MTDPEAIQRFQDLYDQYHRRVRAYAVSRAGRGLADEVVSEVFLVVWRRRGEMPASVLPWLLVVARNVVTSQFRATVRQESIAAEMQVWVKEQQAAADVADEVAERISVLTALAALPEPDRELLTLVAWHGLSPREAAQVAGCSTATYFVRLHRARRRLERALAADRSPAPQGVPAPQGAVQFHVAGYQVIGGMRLEELRASNPGRLPALNAPPGAIPGARVTELNVWVDEHNVVRRMSLQQRETAAVTSIYLKHRPDGTFEVLAPSKADLKKAMADFSKLRAQRHVIFRVDAGLPAARGHNVQVWWVSVTFSGIGVPQVITAPSHAVAVHLRG